MDKETDINKEEIKAGIKHFLLSKTIWVNIIAILTLQAQKHFGIVIDPMTQAEILSFVNVILRLVTHERVVWKS